MMVTWDAPGPGFWELDRSHFVGGETPLIQHIQAQAMPAGMRKVFAELGTPADTLDCGFVNGFMYTRLRPLIAADRPAKNLPPRFVLRAVGRFHPEFRRRTKAAVPGSAVPGAIAFGAQLGEISKEIWRIGGAKLRVARGMARK